MVCFFVFVFQFFFVFFWPPPPPTDVGTCGKKLQRNLQKHHYQGEWIVVGCPLSLSLSLPLITKVSGWLLIPGFLRKISFLLPPPPAGVMRCCRSDWPGLCLFYCYQPSCAVSQQSWFELLFCFINFQILPPPPPQSVSECRGFYTRNKTTLGLEAIANKAEAKMEGWGGWSHAEEARSWMTDRNA